MLDEQDKKILNRTTELLKTQNNHGTEHPFYAVCENDKIPTDSDYSDEWEYVDTYDDYNVIGTTKEDLIEYYNTQLDMDLPVIEDLENMDKDDLYDWLQENSSSCKDYLQKIYYIKVRKFVTGFFTEQAAKDYIEENKHNLVGPYIYTYGMYRNYELQAVLKLLEDFKC